MSKVKENPLDNVELTEEQWAETKKTLLKIREGFTDCPECNGIGQVAKVCCTEHTVGPGTMVMCWKCGGIGYTLNER